MNEDSLSSAATASNFVLLWHQLPASSPRRSHFDLMLEDSGQLRTWAIPRIPSPGESVQGLGLPPHRIAYLDLEGEISGGRGSVRRIDRGTYTIIESSDEQLSIEIRGDQLTGQLRFHATESDQLWEISRVDALANL
ncbi:DNA polymerase ligase N-terminal domain-containing protein [Rosistilla oblonga]|nr:DNA polymerase ligase N-terminal domain-containing protein [Rosistilla oblonga]